MQRRRTSINPLTQAKPAKDIKILEILDCDTGEILDVRQYISNHRYQDIFAPREEARARWKTDTPKYVCVDCLVPVSLLAGMDRNWFFFRHLEEDGRCPAKTRGKLNHLQINAIKFRAQRESEAHIAFKERLAKCIEVDSRFEAPILEGRWTSKSDQRKWRKPDVRSRFNKLDIAFEVQLSTTFLDVVLSRKAFYREDGSALVWLLPYFDPDHSRMMEDDILYSNNKNVFVLDQEAFDVSFTTQNLHFRCWYRRPFKAGMELCGEWVTDVVDFASIKIDTENQSAFYFDYDAEERRVIEEIALERENLTIDAEEKARRVATEKLNDLRSDFECYWYHASRFEPAEDIDWDRLRLKLSSNGALLPEHIHSDADLVAFLNACFSAKSGLSVGWNFADLVKVGHHISDKYTALLPFFGFVCKAHGQSALLRSCDPTGKFQKKMTKINSVAKNERGVFALSSNLSGIAAFLFPEAWEKFDAWISND